MRHRLRIGPLLLGLALLLAGCEVREEASPLPSPEVSLSSEEAPEPSRSVPDPVPSAENPPESAPSEPEESPSAPEAAISSEPPSPSEPLEPSEASSPAEPLPEEPAVFAVAVLSESLRTQVTGVSYQADGPITLDDLRLVTVTYLDFAGVSQTGELLIHHTLAQEVADIFAELYAAGFPIAQIALIDQYGGDDDASMAANNSSAFCTRNIAGTDRYSNHSYGAAVDINPVQNPYVVGETVKPTSAEDYLDRENIRAGMIVEGNVCHTAFTSRGWIWGGGWANPDYQHFEKVIS